MTNYRGLREACGRTYNHASGYVQIVYDKAEKKVVGLDHWTENEWTEHPDYITICNTKKHMTMKQIAERTEEVLRELESMKEERA